MNIYARIHTLLTSDPQKQFAFMVENWVLVQMAICEYLCHIPQIYMPVEAEYIDKWLQLSSKSAQIMNKKTDTFRSEQIDSGNEAWSQWTKEVPVKDAFLPVASPTARYLQYRLTFTSGGKVSAVISNASTIYQVGNLAPVIASWPASAPMTAME